MRQRSRSRDRTEEREQPEEAYEITNPTMPKEDVARLQANDKLVKHVVHPKELGIKIELRADLMTHFKHREEPSIGEQAREPVSNRSYYREPAYPDYAVPTAPRDKRDLHYDYQAGPRIEVKIHQPFSSQSSEIGAEERSKEEKRKQLERRSRSRSKDRDSQIRDQRYKHPTSDSRTESRPNSRPESYTDERRYPAD